MSSSLFYAAPSVYGCAAPALVQSLAGQGFYSAFCILCRGRDAVFLNSAQTELPPSAGVGRRRWLGARDVSARPGHHRCRGSRRSFLLGGGTAADSLAHEVRCLGFEPEGPEVRA